MNQAFLPDTSHIIMPTAYCPPLLYMVFILHYESPQIDIHETYPKQTWRNRCRILTANGLLDLSIPVEKPKHEQAVTGKIITSNHIDWQRNHWRSICSAYRKAPFFIHYADLIEANFTTPFAGCLVEWNQQLLTRLMSEMGIHKAISYTSSYNISPHGQIDFRQYLTPKKPVSLIKWPPYWQVFSDRYEFFPNLSVIDLIFNLGPDAANYLSECVCLYKNQLIDG